MRRPFENRELVATENTVRLTEANRQYLKVRTDERWNLPTNFTLSFVIKELNQPAIILQSDQSKTPKFNFYFASETDPNFQIMDNGGDSVNVNSYSLSSKISLSNVRITVTRIGNVVKFYFNGRLAYTGALYSPITLHNNTGDYIMFGREHVGASNNNWMNGYFSNILLLNGRGFSSDEVEHFHHTNVVPESCHPYVVAHYPLNHDGDIGYDVVEQYNYAKKVAVDFKQDAFNDTNFTILATNGNTASKASGSDADGNYVEFVFTNQEDTPHLVIQPIGSSIITAFFRIVLKFKFVTGATGNTFGFDVDDTTPNVKAFQESVYGTTVKTVSFSQISTANGTGNYTSYLMFSAGSFGTGAEGSKFRLYSMLVSGVLTANNIDLESFSNDEVGVTNELFQSVWRDYYNVRPGTLKTFRVPDTALYGTVTLGLGTLSAWTIVLNITAEHGYVSTMRNVFCNKNTLDAAFFGLFYNDSLVISSIGKIGDFQFYWSGGSYSFGAYNKVPLVCVVTYDGTTLTVKVNSGDGTIYANAFAGSISFDAALMQFFRYTGNPNYGQGACINRFQLFDRVISEYERNLFLQRRVFPYDDKLLPGSQLDVNFGEVFLSGSDYKVRDYSGNNRHVLLNNFNPSTAQPLLVEQSSGMPPIRKTLKLNGTNQFLKVANFNPTKEKGYTYIIGFCLPTNTDINGYFLAKRENSNARAKLLYNGGSNKTLGFLNYNPPASASGVGNNNFLNYDTSKPLFYCCTNSAVDGIAYSYPFGHYQAYTNDLSSSGFGWDEVDSGDLFIGADDQAWSASGYLNGYIFLVGIWKGVLKRSEILNIINNGQGQNRPDLMVDCQLYLNFDEIRTDVPLLSMTNIVTGIFVSPSGDAILTYGNDSDGNYAEYEFVSANSSVTSSFPTYWSATPNRAYKGVIKFKRVTSPSGGKILLGGGPHGIDVTGTVGVLQEVETPYTGIGYGEPVRVLLNFDSGAAAAGAKFRVYSVIVKYTEPNIIKDWSPQNRVVVLSNYSANEINPAHADYRLINIDTLKQSFIADTPLPSSILAKTWAHYKCDKREQLVIGVRGETEVWKNLLGDTSKDLSGTNFSGRIITSLRRRRYKDSSIFLLESIVEEDGARVSNLNMATKNMNFMHNGGDWFVAFIYGRQSGLTSYFWNPIINTGAKGGGGPGYIGIDIMVHPGIPAITVLVENNVGRAMTYQSDVVPADLLHLIVITFDADASSNNCKAYLNGTLMSASGATSTQVYSSADGSNLPEIFKFQSNSDPKAVFHGEMIIGNQLPDSTELAALTSYFTGKYGSFPKPL